MQQLAAERKQLVDSFCSIDYGRLLEALKRVRQPGTSRGHYIRQFHNVLGYRAAGTACDGGACLGCLYRTHAFVQTPLSSRFGAKRRPPHGMTSVHVEHTVPINALVRYIDACQTFREDNNTSPQDSRLLRFLLRFSIVTAALPTQGKIEPDGMVREGYSHATDALTPNDIGYNLPFLRYVEPPFDIGDRVYDVLNGEEICPDRFTFHDHIVLLKNLVKEARRKDDLARLVESL